MSKKFVYTGKMDNDTIILGFGARRVDAMATANAVKEQLLPHDEELNKKVKDLQRKVQTDHNNDPGGKVSLASRAVIMKQMKKHAAARKQIQAETVVYLYGGEHKVDIDEKTFEKLSKLANKIPTGKVLTTAGIYIPDTRPEHVRLSPEDELKIKKSALMKAAMDRRSAMEIEGNTEALVISQKWYAEQLKKLGSK